MKQFIFTLMAFLLGVTLLTSTASRTSDTYQTTVTETAVLSPPGFTALTISDQTAVQIPVTASIPFVTVEFIGGQSQSLLTSTNTPLVPPVPERCSRQSMNTNATLPTNSELVTVYTEHTTERWRC